MNSRDPLWSLVKLSDTNVLIEDVGHDKCRLSVTNGAETVVEELFLLYGNKRFFYLDSMNEWGELKHNNGSFTGFGFVADISLIEKI